MATPFAGQIKYKNFLRITMCSSGRYLGGKLFTPHSPGMDYLYRRNKIIRYIVIGITQKMDHEANRLEELRKYNILDSLTEEDYDDITFLASTICNVPVALISFVDEGRQWFKSHTGVSISETSREYSFCSHAIASADEIMIVQDSRLDERFRNNPLVTGDPGIVFYAGIPLVNDSGYGLGTVCVIDMQVRTLSEAQVKALKVLSKQVMHLLELRKMNHELELLRRQLETRNKDLEQFAMVVSHDIKSPLTSVLLANDMLESDFHAELGNDGIRLVSISNKSVNKIKSLVDGILSYYQKEDTHDLYQEIDLPAFFESFTNTVYSPRKWTLTHQLCSSTLFFNRTQLEQIFFNLISNSIRYNDKERVNITVSLTETPTHYEFTVADNGIGISATDLDKIFNLFTTASVKDHYGHKGTGIGLSTVKRIVETAGGTIQVQSEKGKGTTFVFTLGKK